MDNNKYSNIAKMLKMYEIGSVVSDEDLKYMLSFKIIKNVRYVKVVGDGYNYKCFKFYFNNGKSNIISIKKIIKKCEDKTIMDDIYEAFTNSVLDYIIKLKNDTYPGYISRIKNKYNFKKLVNEFIIYKNINPETIEYANCNEYGCIFIDSKLKKDFIKYYDKNKDVEVIKRYKGFYHSSNRPTDEMLIKKYYYDTLKETNNDATRK